MRAHLTARARRARSPDPTGGTTTVAQRALVTSAWLTEPRNIRRTGPRRREPTNTVARSRARRTSARAVGPESTCVTTMRSGCSASAGARARSRISASPRHRAPECRRGPHAASRRLGGVVRRQSVQPFGRSVVIDRDHHAGPGEGIADRNDGDGPVCCAGQPRAQARTVRVLLGVCVLGPDDHEDVVARSVARMSPGSPRTATASTSSDGCFAPMRRARSAMSAWADARTGQRPRGACHRRRARG